jgi:hypothetical protein
VKSVFVFSRSLPDGRTTFAVGEGVVPPGCFTVGTFLGLPEAVRFRDKKRMEAVFGLVDDPTPYRKPNYAPRGR